MSSPARATLLAVMSMVLGLIGPEQAQAAPPQEPGVLKLFEAVDAKAEEGLTYYGDRWVSTKVAEASRKRDQKKLKLDFRFNTLVNAKNYRLFSDASLQDTMLCKAVLDQTVEQYMLLNKPLGLRVTKKKIPVFLVDRFADYSRLTGAKSKNMPGLYRGSTAALYIYSSKENPSAKGNEFFRNSIMMETAAHEMTHGLDFYYLPRFSNGRGGSADGIKTWFLEGRADYLCYMRKGVEMAPGTYNLRDTTARWQYLEGLHNISDEELIAEFQKVMAMDATAWFKTRGAKKYALSWSLAAYLMDGEDGKYRKRFEAFLKQAPQRVEPQHFEKTVAPLSKLLPGYRAFVAEQILTKPPRD